MLLIIDIDITPFHYAIIDISIIDYLRHITTLLILYIDIIIDIDIISLILIISLLALLILADIFITPLLILLRHYAIITPY
jgi:hypothetical protein